MSMAMSIRSCFADATAQATYNKADYDAKMATDKVTMMAGRSVQRQDEYDKQIADYQKKIADYQKKIDAVMTKKMAMIDADETKGHAASEKAWQKQERVEAIKASNASIIEGRSYFEALGDGLEKVRQSAAEGLSDAKDAVSSKFASMLERVHATTERAETSMREGTAKIGSIFKGACESAGRKISDSVQAMADRSSDIIDRFKSGVNNLSRRNVAVESVSTDMSLQDLRKGNQVTIDPIVEDEHELSIDMEKE